MAAGDRGAEHALPCHCGGPRQIPGAVLRPKLADDICCQDIREADKITKINSDLDDVKEVLQRSIDQVLQRGEKLDDIVAKSEDLSNESKAFLQTSKDATSCCTLL